MPMGLWRGRWMLGFLVCATALGCESSRQRTDVVDPAELQSAVDQLLDESASAWNRGDLDGFVRWYKQSAETTFLGASGLTHGWDAVRARYAASFEPGAPRDSLRFEGLETRPLAGWLGLATARYVLFQGDSLTSTGVFTLVVENTPEGWRIVHDHSSAASN
jgi:ketosteroid isomerase-like protein